MKNKGIHSLIGKQVFIVFENKLQPAEIVSIFKQQDKFGDSIKEVSVKLKETITYPYEFNVLFSYILFEK